MSTVKNSPYYENLIQQVINNSISPNWETAVLEWELYDFEEDETLLSSCICGKEKLRYLFTIRNMNNGKFLYPIGSSCIKRFERQDLNEVVTIKEELFRLLHALEKGEYIKLSSDLFSRRLLNYFYEEGVFRANSFNGFDPKSDYLFLLKMFNKRDKNNLSVAQSKKITAIIMNSVRPYLRSILRDKVKHRREDL